MKPRRSHFIIGFTFVVTALAITKCIFPEWTLDRLQTEANKEEALSVPPDSITLHAAAVDSLLLRKRPSLTLTDANGKAVKRRVVSVPNFDISFPDLNDVQLATACRLGIPQIKNREDARHRKKELVFIGDNPFYAVEDLNQSIPYLIPRAATLLEEIGRAFNDSLVTKGFYTPHKLLVTSVLRTNEDISRLRRFNANASENSCHRFGTTFDISYNRFLEIKENGESEIKWVTVFKSILAEVLDDQRKAGTCYVKYERKQSCFHITAR